MADERFHDSRNEPLSFHIGDRIPAVTQDGQRMYRSPEDRVPAVSRVAGHTGNVWSQDYEVPAGDANSVERDNHSATVDHHNTGDAMTWRDAQYGASPLRFVRYAEDEKHNRAGDKAASEDSGDGRRAGTGSPQNRTQGQGHDERGDYGSASESSRPEHYSGRTS